jgi:CheY-like chemotaxis protein
VLTASHGAEAIATADQEQAEIHLLLTDVIMPNMFGKALAAEFRARRPGIPVLFMSGYAQPVLAAQGTLDPGVHLLSKPFSERELLNRIRQVLDGDRPTGPET